MDNTALYTIDIATQQLVDISTDLVLELEQRYNIVIDIVTLMYTKGNRNDTYGWQPLTIDMIRGR